MRPGGASLSHPCGWPLGGVLCRPQMAAPLSRSALRARDALVLEHLSLADAVASAVARRFFPLVEREDLIQVARDS